MPTMPDQSQKAWTVWPWVVGTPLGYPVVPEVKRMSLRLSAVTDAARAASPSPATSFPVLASASQHSVPSGAGPRITTVCASSPTSSPASCPT